MTIISHDEMREKVLGIPHGESVIFSVTFVKRTTGELRKMVCRRGVKKYLAGGELKYNAHENTLLPVYDLQKEGYRMISCESIQELVFRGETFQVPNALVISE
jgi:hypothetical protein